MTTATRLCSMDGCEQPILLNPETRTVCAACELRGGPPPAAEPVPDQATATGGMPEQATTPSGLPEGLTCSRDDCTRPILNLEDPDWDGPPAMSRAEREAAGLRTECWMHHRETHGLVGEYMFYPGKGVEKVS